MKKFIFLSLLFFIGIPAFSAPGTIVSYTINAEKNAYEHNNLGIMYVEEKDYYAAIQEFKIAISLNPKTQATAVYYNNLGKVYMKIGYPELALDCFNALGKIDEQLEIYKMKSSTPYDKVVLGLLYEKTGDIKKAIFVFDEFISTEPNLMITSALKLHIQELVNKVL